MRVAATQLPLPAISPPRRRRRAQHAPPAAAPRTPPGALSAILRSRVIACLRAEDGVTALQAAHAAVRGGVTVFHAPLLLLTYVPYCSVGGRDVDSGSAGGDAGFTLFLCKVVEDLCRSYPSLTFGVGTVLNAADARKAIGAGAQFLMSPGTVMEILHDLEESKVHYIPGVLTPTEVLSACSAGAEVVKVYPVSVMGGEVYMSALKKPFPHVPMVASQGIQIGSIKGYVEAGASAVVLSDAIFDKELMRKGKFSEISELASLATFEALQSIK
ncbi:KHG/KDPG aldolase-like [Panicum miliaceum]|uniref:KHG/KDPG aldolase-like n=1 Tax=Panicum miliaceum TaxID=4540 RepID=A0A3L6T6V3_PANMI|nr:KHG/KDPG aldolase-like [Panicum miliaceum]